MLRISLLGAVLAVALAPAGAFGAEPTPGASGTPFRGLRGFVDAHLHITANARAGGRVIYGEPFDPRGIAAALGGDASEHGTDGSLDVTGNLLRSGLPFGMHGPDGWPTFAGWPTFDTMTHQQTYWVWLERAWMAGLRLVVAQAAEDEPLCRIEPVRSHSCSEPAAIRLQIRSLRGLQRYVDARSGERGKGWFRLVFSPAQARRVIERGKLAVIIGMESSDPLGCTATPAVPRCTAAQVDRRLKAFWRLGVRAMFVAHWIDNAFGGAALEGGAKGAFINVFNRLQTGDWFHTAPCPEAGEGEEVETLAQGELRVLAGFFPGTSALADEGAVQRGGADPTRTTSHPPHDGAAHADRGRSPERARPGDRPPDGRGGALPAGLQPHRHRWHLDPARPAPPLRGWGVRDRPRGRRGPARRPGSAARPAGARARRPGHRHRGLRRPAWPPAGRGRPPAALPVPLLRRPRAVVRQRTGDRTFDLNTDGVAQYGLFADLLADMQRTRRGRAALRVLFTSAQAYLATWQRTGA